MKKSSLLLTAALAISAFSLSARATVIDFNANGVQDYFIGSATSQGFTFTPTGVLSNLGTSDNFDGAGQGNGTVSLTAWSNSASSTLLSFSADDSHLFSLQSFEFNNAYPDHPAYARRTDTLTVVGTYADNSTTSQVFGSLLGISSFQQLDLNSSFANLASVAITADGDANVRALFDNFTVDQASNVPDSGGTMALFGLALAVVAAARRKFLR